MRDHDYAWAYRFLDGNLAASLPQEQFAQMAEAREAADGAVSRYAFAPDLAITTTPLPGEPLPLVTFTRNPTEKVIVKAMRANGTMYLVHLQVRHVGKGWKISAFDRI